MADIFISYSRRDKDFVQVLHNALLASTYDTWVDWQDIAPTTEWWREIETGIETAHTFIFVISQDSIASDYCRKEVDHAVAHGKRLIPVLRRKDFTQADMHPKLGQHQWVAFQAEDDFETAFAALVETIDTDLEHKKAHTRLEVRAIEWAQSNHDASLLLRDSELNRAEQWLLQASGGKDPKPTALQGEYIATSRQAATQAQEQANQRQRRTVAALSGLLLVTTGAGVWAWVQQQTALTREVNATFLADSLTMEAYLEAGLETDAVAQAVRTGQALHSKRAHHLEPSTRFRAITSIREIMYGVRERERLIGHGDGVTGVAFSPDGQTLATASEDTTVKLWNLQGEELQTFEGHSDWVTSVAFSPDGQTLATASEDTSVKLWNLQGEELQTLKGHKNGVNSVAFSPDGQTLATASEDNTVKLWNRQGEELQTLKGHSDWVNSVAFSPDGQTLATTSDDDTVKLWNRQGEELQTLKGHSNWVNSVTFSPDGQTLATASDDATVKLWNRQNLELQTLKGHSDRVNSVAFSPDGQTLATASGDDTVQLWNRQGEKLQTLKGHSDSVSSVAFSPNGQTIATAGLDNIVKLWNQQGNVLQTLKGHNREVLRLAFSPDGQILATPSADTTVKLWNLQGEELQTLKGHREWINSVAFSPDGQTLATASRDKTVKLWNLQGEKLQTLRNHSDEVFGVAFSPDGKTIATASSDNTVKLWNQQGNVLQTLKGHSDEVFGVAFSPDGKTIATASKDNTVKLWNQQGKELQTLEGHSNAVFSLAFSPDGQTIATASFDNTVKLWNFDLENLMARGCNWLDTYFVKKTPELLMELKTCQQQDPALKVAAAPMLVIQGEKLAREGNVKRARELFQQAVTWDSRLKLDPKTKAQNLAALQKHLDEGYQFLIEGHVPEAVKAHRQAEALGLEDDISAQDWNSLCWIGSTYNQAKIVIFACEKAVALAPNDGGILDSRGLARTLTGDTQGAIADFKAFIEWTGDKDDKAQRQDWIQALESGTNPFTPEVLEELRNEQPPL
ncbi:MAG: TIR domain-containing protein [Nodosilinea sp.]